MRKIYKYPLHLVNDQTVTMPGSPTVLSAGLDPVGDICIWAEVSPGEMDCDVVVSVRGTGHERPPSSQRFIGTVPMGRFIRHVYASH